MDKLLVKLVSNFPKCFKYIKNPSEEVQLAAVKQNGFLIKHIKNPSPYIQKIAVYTHYKAISDIQNPSQDVQDYIIHTTCYHGFRWIQNPSDETLRKVQKEIMIHKLSRYPNQVSQ